MRPFEYLVLLAAAVGCSTADPIGTSASGGGAGDSSGGTKGGSSTVANGGSAPGGDNSSSQSGSSGAGSSAPGSGGSAGNVGAGGNAGAGGGDAGSAGNVDSAGSAGAVCPEHGAPTDCAGYCACWFEFCTAYPDIAGTFGDGEDCLNQCAQFTDFSCRAYRVNNKPHTHCYQAVPGSKCP